eukprot:10441939-Alexandrium_andersonii.AAC.1
MCFVVRPVCRAVARSTLVGLGPLSGEAHMPSAIAAAVAALSSAIPAGTKACKALPALPCRAHLTAAARFCSSVE